MEKSVDLTREEAVFSEVNSKQEPDFNDSDIVKLIGIIACMYIFFMIIGLVMTK